MGEQSSGEIAMEIDMNQEPYPDQLSVAIANIGALNLNDSIPQPFNRFGSNLYNPDTWEHVLIYPRNRGEKKEASETSVAALKKSNDGSVYDCNICLDLAKEPVVTCCGHLFCWPCLYRWLNLRSSRTRTKECPVCKGEVTDQDVIPIYGVGNDDEVRNEGSSSATPQIPRRPNAKRVSRDPNVMQMRVRTLDRGASFSALFNLSER
ncbi:RING/U-box superfamily protein [Trifolium repens]|nr:RING/U-box superfamily protein [Trifolium repens]